MKFRSNIFSDEKVVKTSIKVDILDIIINGITAVVTGSVVMLAETLQGISDLTSAGFVYVGMKRSKRPSTEKYPLGFGRELYVWSLFSTLIMFLVLASLSFYFGFQRFTNPEPIDHIFLAYFVLTIASVTNGYSFSLAFRRILRRRKVREIRKSFSQSTFLETKITFTLDLLGTLAALFGLVSLILFQVTGNLRFDGLGAMGIGLLMAFFSVWLFKNIRDFIVGVTAPEETKREIKETTLKVGGVKEVLDLKAIVIGSSRLSVILDIHVCPDLKTREIEKLIEEIKGNIKKRIPSAYHVQVELETPENE